MDIGPIFIDWFTPTLTVDSSPMDKGTSSWKIGGAAPHLVVEELRELVENYHGRVTIGTETGVLEYVRFGCASLESRDGWYLLQGFNESIDKLHMDAIDSTDIDLGHGDTAVLSFSISAAYLGDMA